MNINKIQNLDDLRDHAIGVLEALRKREIDVDEASTTAKLCETIISTVKNQLAYAAMSGMKPKINFMGDCTEEKVAAIEKTPAYTLLKDNKKP